MGRNSTWICAVVVRLKYFSPCRMPSRHDALGVGKRQSASEPPAESPRRRRRLFAAAFMLFTNESTCGPMPAARIACSTRCSFGGIRILIVALSKYPPGRPVRGHRSGDPLRQRLPQPARGLIRRQPARRQPATRALCPPAHPQNPGSTDPMHRFPHRNSPPAQRRTTFSFSSRNLYHHSNRTQRARTHLRYHQSSKEVRPMPDSLTIAQVDSPSALALWHLLSLDAPTVATLWLVFVARTTHTALPPLLAPAMFLAVWLIYAADRLLDAARTQDPGRLADPSALEPRHCFHQRHRISFFAAMVVAAISLSCLLFETRLPAAYLPLAAIFLAWFAAVHLPRVPAAARLPKEPVTGLIFAAAVFAPEFPTTSPQPSCLPCSAPSTAPGSIAGSPTPGRLPHPSTPLPACSFVRFPSSRPFFCSVPCVPPRLLPRLPWPPPRFFSLTASAADSPRLPCAPSPTLPCSPPSSSCRCWLDDANSRLRPHRSLLPLAGIPQPRHKPSSAPASIISPPSPRAAKPTSSATATAASPLVSSPPTRTSAPTPST